MGDNEIFVLEGQDVVDLWLRGKDEWNVWVKENPECTVDFSYVDFSEYRGEDEVVSFSGFIIPNDYGCFIEVSFGKADVSFDDAFFCGAGLSFSGSIFEGGIISFDHVKFNGDRLSFMNVKFGIGKVTFYGVYFKNKQVDFRSSIFGKGGVSFKCSYFSNSEVLFENVHFQGDVDLVSLFNSEEIKRISFKNSSFEKSLDLSGNHFNCIPDLTGTKIINQISLAGLTCSLQSKWWRGNTEDAEKLRRLKDLATIGNDHELALSFHADEMRAKRWKPVPKDSSLPNGKIALKVLINSAVSCLDLLFSLFSDYGQSFVRPLIGYVGSLFIFSWIYASMIPDKLKETAGFDAFLFSCSNGLPLIKAFGGVHEKGMASLEGVDYLYPALASQSIISIAFIFLIGLGLRNKFRI